MADIEVDELLPQRVRPRSAEAPEVLRAAAAACERGHRAVLATVLARHGSAPATPGQKLLLSQAERDLEAIGTVGGGALERAVLQLLFELLHNPQAKAYAQTFRLGASLGMCCGGRVEIFFEPLQTSLPVLIVGAGHVGSATAQLLASCGFHITLVDQREIWAKEDCSTSLLQRICGDYNLVAEDFPEHGAVLAITHDHRLDQDVIEWALRKSFAFIGGVGSRAKYVRTCERLLAKEFSKASVERLRMPIGLPIGARTAHEIAVSIAAELIAWKHQIDSV